MKLYMKYRSVSLKDKFGIYDENDNIVFHVVREFFTIGAMAHIYDKDRNELYMIKSVRSFLKEQYIISSKNKTCAIVTRKLSLIKPRIKIESDFGPLVLTGNFLGRDYEIMCGEKLIGSIHRKMMPWSDRYEIIIPEEEHLSLICALFVTIDLCIRNRQ